MRRFIDIVTEAAEQLDEIRLREPYNDDVVNPIGQFGKSTEEPTVVAEFDDVRVIRTWGDMNRSEYRMFRGDDFLGGLRLMGAQVMWSGLKPSERGKGYGLKLYDIALNDIGWLESDDVQTTKSKAVWDKLFDLGYPITARTFGYNEEPVTKEDGVLTTWRYLERVPVYSDDPNNNVKSLIVRPK